MNTTLKIKVKLGSAVIKYEQETCQTSLNAATIADGHSKASCQKQLIKTIQQICKEVLILNNQ